MAGRWPVVDASGLVVETFGSRADARAYAKAHGLRGTAEYRARVAPKVATGLTLSQARGHPPGGARHTVAHRFRGRKHGTVVREQWTIGLASENGEEYTVTVRQALRRLAAFRRANPDLDIVGVALHGKPYKARPGVVRWTGFVQTLDDFEAQLTDALDDGIEDLADVHGLADFASWASIDELTLYRPEA